MDITDADGLWRVTYHHIENRKTNELRRVKDIPSTDALAYMPYETFLRKCEVAFNTGKWPT